VRVKVVRVKKQRQDQRHSAIPITTNRILVFALTTALSVLVIGVGLQWIIYVHWMNESGPVRLVGAFIAAGVSFAFVFHWQEQVRARQREVMRRLQVIADMNDRIRNALQAIDCSLYAANPTMSKQAHDAIERIDSVLREVVSDSTGFRPSSKPRPAVKIKTFSQK
jgi:hypothetical protein